MGYLFPGQYARNMIFGSKTDLIAVSFPNDSGRGGVRNLLAFSERPSEGREKLLKAFTQRFIDCGIDIAPLCSVIVTISIQ